MSPLSNYSCSEIDGCLILIFTLGPPSATSDEGTLHRQISPQVRMNAEQSMKIPHAQLTQSTHIIATDSQTTSYALTKKWSKNTAEAYWQSS